VADRRLLIGEAAELLGVSVKAIRVYHARGLLPEPERDASGYRRYGPAELVVLARIARLRAIGLPLREIAPLVRAADGGAALRDRLRELDAELAGEIAEREARRAVVAQLLAEGIDDPIAASEADMWEERSVALLRAAIPDLTPEQELVERRLARALAAFVPAVQGPEEEVAIDAALDALGEAEWSRFVDQHRRFHALAGAEPDDPDVAALAREMEDDMRALLDAAVGSAPGGADAADREELERFDAAFAAAREVLAPAQRRVMELALAPLLSGRP
jgi:DNA-binding transcriptional MerR regulator